MGKCACKINGYDVKDAEARERITIINNKVDEGHAFYNKGMNEFADSMVQFNERLTSVEQNSGSGGSSKLYLHRVKVNSIYNEETWAEDPSFEFYIIFYRTSNTPVTAFNEIQPYEMKLENPFQLIKYDAPEANVIAIGIEKRSDGNLRISYINNINEFEGSWLNYENYHFSVFTIEDTVYEV